MIKLIVKCAYVWTLRVMTVNVQIAFECVVSSTVVAAYWLLSVDNTIVYFETRVKHCNELQLRA